MLDKQQNSREKEPSSRARNKDKIQSRTESKSSWFSSQAPVVLEIESSALATKVWSTVSWKFSHKRFWKMAWQISANLPTFDNHYYSATPAFSLLCCIKTHLSFLFNWTTCSMLQTKKKVQENLNVEQWGMYLVLKGMCKSQKENNLRK